MPIHIFNPGDYVKIRDEKPYNFIAAGLDIDLSARLLVESIRKTTSYEHRDAKKFRHPQILIVRIPNVPGLHEFFGDCFEIAPGGRFKK